MKEKSWNEVRVFVVVFIAACGFLILAGGQSVFAHGGGLNEQGCHNKRATGECHCHRDEQGKKISPPVLSPDRCEKSSPKDDNRSEMDFVAQFCHARGGQIEKSLPNGMRADCITKEHVIEGDFARKWKEAFLQAQHYAIEADRRAGILLILENENDKVYIEKTCFH